MPGFEASAEDSQSGSSHGHPVGLPPALSMATPPKMATYRPFLTGRICFSTRAMMSEAGTWRASQIRNRTSNVGDLWSFSKWLM